MHQVYSSDSDSSEESNGDLLELNEQLLEAAVDGDIKLVRELLQQGAEINATDEKGKTGLHYAAKFGYTKMSKALLEMEADSTIGTNADDNWPESLPIHYAAYEGHIEIIKQLIADDPTTINDQEGLGFAPLHLAILNNKLDVVKELFQQSNTDINLQTNNSEGDDAEEIPRQSTPLVMAVIRAELYRKYEILELFLKQREELDVQLKTAYEPVELLSQQRKELDAQLKNLPKIVESYLKQQGKLDFKQKIFPEIELRLKKRREELDAQLKTASKPVKLLLRKKPDIELPVNSNDPNESYFEYGNIRLPDRSNILHLAVCLENMPIIKLLLDRLPQQDVNQENDPAPEEWEEFNGYTNEDYPGECTPLDYAVQLKNEKMIITFIQSEKIDHYNRYVDGENTLLHVACREGWISVIRLLADIEAVDFSAKNFFGHSIVKIANINNQRNVLEELGRIYHAKKKVITLRDNNSAARKDIKTHRLVERIKSEIIPEIGGLDYLYSLPDDFVVEHTNTILPELFPTSSDSENNDDELSESEDLTPLAAAYKKDDYTSAKLIHSFPEACTAFELEVQGQKTLKDPASFIRSEKMKKLHESAKKRKRPEITTIGDSSEASIMGDRDIQEASLVSNEQLPDPFINEQEALRLLDQLNQEIKEGNKLNISDDEFPFVIAHFRGINFNRQLFNSEQKKAFIQMAKGKGIHSKMSYANVGIAFNSTTEQDENLVLEIDKKIREFWKEVLGQKFPVEQYWEPKGKNKAGKKKEKFIFKKIKHLVQARYTGLASKLGEDGQHEDIWQEIWSHVEKELLPQLDIKYQKYYEDLSLKENLFVSMGKTPQHAVRYAVGKSVTKGFRETRADSRYRNTGKAKHRLIGAVYITLHTVKEYFEANPSDVTKLNHKKNISVHQDYLNETEVSFPGGIGKEYVVAVIPVYDPDFEKSWEELDQDTIDHYKKWYGLDKILYTNYYYQYRATVKPDGTGMNILKQKWIPEYGQKYGLTKEKFDLFNHILNQLDSDKPCITEAEFSNAIPQSDIRKLKFNKNGKLSLKTANAIKAAIDKEIRTIHPRRVVKNKYRDHLFGYKANGKHVEGHLCKILMKEAFNHAQSKGKQLIFRDADGKFELYPTLSSKAKQQISAKAKRKKIPDGHSPKSKTRKITSAHQLLITHSPEISINASTKKRKVESETTRSPKRSAITLTSQSVKIQPDNQAAKKLRIDKDISVNNGSYSLQKSNQKSSHSQNQLFKQLMQNASDWEEMMLAATSQKSLLKKSGNTKQKLAAEAAQYGFNCIDVKPDGNCFFHAVLHQFQQMNLAGLRNLTIANIKESALNYILDHLEHYNAFIGENSENFIDRLLKGEWADNIFIHATAKAFDITIAIVESDGSPPKIINKQNPIKTTLYLGHEILAGRDQSIGLHYQSLIKNDQLVAVKKIETVIAQADVDSFASLKAEKKKTVTAPTPVPQLPFLQAANNHRVKESTASKKP